MNFRYHRCIARSVMEIMRSVVRILQSVARTVRLREIWLAFLALFIGSIESRGVARYCALLRAALDRMARCIAISSFPRNRESKAASARVGGGVEPPDAFCTCLQNKAVQIVAAVVVAIVAAAGGVARADKWNEYGNICVFSENGKEMEMHFNSREGAEVLGSFPLVGIDARFVKEVNRLMDDGWQPLGGTDSVVVAGSIVGICQTMVK